MSSRLPARSDSHSVATLPSRDGEPGSFRGRGHARGEAAAGSAAGVSDLQRYAHVLRHRWRLVLGVAAAVVAAVAIGTLAQTPIYRASGLIELRGQSSDGVPIEALLQASRLSSQFLGTQHEVLRSPALARRVMAAVTPPAAGAAGAGAALPVAVDSGGARARELDAFRERLMVAPVAGSNLVWVHFESPDPALAARVVNAVFEHYARMRVEAARASVARLAAEADAARGRLTLAERQLQEFARDNGLAFAAAERDGRDDLPRERLRVLDQQLAEAEADRYNKESLYDLVRSRGGGLLESEILQALNVRLAALRSEHAKLRTHFLEDYPRTREVKTQIDEVEALLAREEGRLRGAVTSRYLAAVRRQELLRRAAADERALVERQGDRTTQYRILSRDVEAQQQLYARLQERVRAGEVSAAVAATDVAVVEAAATPADPVRPVLATNLKLALLVGLVLGVAAAFVRDSADVTVRTAGELDSLAVPLIGLIPAVEWPAERGIRGWAHRVGGGRSALARMPSRGGPPPLGAPQAVLLDGPSPAGPERAMLEDAFGGLRTAVLFAARENAATRTLLVTSARPGDGKTTVAVNLALSLARLGGRVLLVDADTRRPTTHHYFGVSRDHGLSEFLSGEASWTSLALRDVAPGLDLLPAGRPVAAPAEALSSERPLALLEEARGEYDFIVVDSPAMHINASDTRLLAPLVDGIVVVVRSGTTPRPLVEAMLRQLPNVVGVVLNDVDRRDVPTYYSAYAAPDARAAFS